MESKLIMLGHQELKERLAYNPETGEFCWTASLLNRAAMHGKRAGSKSAEGYVTIKIDGHQKRAHCWA